MIYLGTNSNIITLTLSELTPVVYGVTYSYLFNFINEINGTESNFISIDESLFPQRYNKFEIIVDETEDLLNGIVNLEAGFYNYNIYYQESTINLNTASASGIVEIGKVYMNSNSHKISVDNIYL